VKINRKGEFTVGEAEYDHTRHRYRLDRRR